MVTNMKRRTVLGLGASALCLGTVLGVGGALAQSGPIRIGVITQLSGPSQAYGKAAVAGMQVAVDRYNADGGINGQQIEIVVRDDGGSTEKAVQAYRELVGEGVGFLIGGPISGPALAVTPLAGEDEVLFIGAGPTNLAMTHEDYNPNVFRLAFTTIPYHGSLIEEVVRQNPEVTEWAAITVDAQTARDITRVLSNAVIANAQSQHGVTATVLDPIVVKGGAGDYRTQIAQLANSDATGLLNVIYGSDAITFYKQARAYGFDQKFAVIVDNGGELQMAQALGADMHPNMWSPTPFYAGALPDSPMAQELHERASAALGDPYPFGYIGYGHDAIIAFAEGIRAAGSTDIDAVRTAIETGSPEGALGPVVFRAEDHAYLGTLFNLNFGADANAPEGWSILGTYTTSADDYIEPASPGERFVIP